MKRSSARGPRRGTVAATIVLVVAAGLIQGPARARSVPTARNGAVIAAVDRTVATDQLRDVHGDMNLFSFNPSGTVTQLTDTPEDDYAPDVSPDGRYIAFTRGLPAEGIAGDICILDTLSGEVTNLTQSPAVHEWGPSWSPDGKRIAFVGSAGGPQGTQRLYKMRPDGAGVTEISELSLGAAGQEAATTGVPWKIDWGPRP